MSNDYIISLSRTPDGQLIITTDPTIPMAHECILGQWESQTGTVFIRLDIIHKGKAFPVWYCDADDQADQTDWQKVIERRRPQIIEALKRWERAHNLQS